MGAALLAAMIAGVEMILITRGRRHRAPPDPIADAAVARRVEAHLRAQLDAKAEDFSVRVRRGRVVLRGEAPSLAEMQRLEAEIGRIDGVVGVDNLLRLWVRSEAVLQGGPAELGAWLS